MSKEVVIDPGHQAWPDEQLELSAPEGPMKPRCARGSVGKVSGVAEHELTLALGSELAGALGQLEIPTLLCRQTHEVNLSNRERAGMANQADGVCFVRLHFNSSPDPQQHGVECYVASHRRVGEVLLLQSLELALQILDKACSVTRLSRRWVTVRDDLTGLNWCRIPAVVVELGFLSNTADEQVILQSDFMKRSAGALASAIESWMLPNQRDRLQEV